MFFGLLVFCSVNIAFVTLFVKTVNAEFFFIGVSIGCLIGGIIYLTVLHANPSLIENDLPGKKNSEVLCHQENNSAAKVIDCDTMVNVFVEIKNDVFNK